VLRVLFFSIIAIAAAQVAPLPVEQEPHHHLLLKNEFVEIFRTTIAPGESTLFHIHSHDGAGVALVARTTTECLLGGTEGAAATFHSGQVFAPSRLSGPVTHRVHNVGSTAVDDIYVELLQRPSQPSTTVMGSPAAENGSARMFSWELAPGAVTPMHSHTRPYLIVAVTFMHLKMVAPDGRSLTEDVKPGDFHWVDAKVTHALANDGTTPGQLVEIELK
jgi:quercetin dioxygenase-like cupin family protein